MTGCRFVSYFRTLFALFTFLCAAPVHAADTNDGFRVVTWNVEWLPGRKPDATPEDGATHMAAVKKALKEFAPDVLIAEEIRDHKVFDDFVSALPGLKTAVVSAFRDPATGSIAGQQIGIASKLPCIASWSEKWQSAIDSVPRGFSFAAIEDPGSKKLILVYGVHLKSNRDRGDARIAELNTIWRDESARSLLRHIEDMEETVFKGEIRGIIVGGDINTNHDGQFKDHVVEMMVRSGFHNCWEGVPPEDRQTWRGGSVFLPTTFDYFFTKGLGKLRAELVPVADDTSDHHPVLITVPRT